MEVPHSKKLALCPLGKSLQGQKDWAPGQSSWKVAPKVRTAAEGCPPFPGRAGTSAIPFSPHPALAQHPSHGSVSGLPVVCSNWPELPHPKH